MAEIRVMFQFHPLRITRGTSVILSLQEAVAVGSRYCFRSRFIKLYNRQGETPQLPPGIK